MNPMAELEKKISRPDDREIDVLPLKHRVSNYHTTTAPNSWVNDVDTTESTMQPSEPMKTQSLLSLKRLYRDRQTYYTPNLPTCLRQVHQ